MAIFCNSTQCTGQENRETENVKCIAWAFYARAVSRMFLYIHLQCIIRLLRKAWKVVMVLYVRVLTSSMKSQGGRSEVGEGAGTIKATKGKDNMSLERRPEGELKS